MLKKLIALIVLLSIATVITVTLTAKIDCDEVLEKPFSNTEELINETPVVMPNTQELHTANTQDTLESGRCSSLRIDNLPVN